MVTIKDVAKYAGVSSATASRAIRNIGYMRPETREKVLQAVEALGYIADQAAQQLKNGMSNVVGIIVSDVNNYFYNLAISMLTKRLRSDGKTVMLAYSNEDSEEERECFRTLLAAKVCAIIFTPVADQNYDLVRRTMENGIRVTQLYRRVYGNVNAIVFDDEDSAYIAAKHLFEIGCKRPLLIDVSYYNLKSDHVIPNRTNGFLRAVREFGISEYRYFEHTLLETYDPAFEQLFAEFQPDAVLSGNNTFTLELLNLMQKYGLHYPQDVKIVTFDDINWVSHLGLSAIRQPVDQLVEKLYPLIFRTDAPTLIRIKSDLILRKSTTIQQSSTHA